jgi:D-3-phosphoglycerate dehydrogenase
VRVLITTAPFGVASREPLELLGHHRIDFVVNPFGRRVTEAELAQLIPGFDALIAGTEPITARVIDAADRLKLISRVGIGLDNVDLSRARDRGIQVAYTPDGPAPAVSELTVGLMISLLRDIAGTAARMRRHDWHRFMGRRLAEMTVGILGVGRVGSRVARHLLDGFPGVRILAHDLVPRPGLAGISWVDPARLLRESDIVTIHVPLTAATRHMIASRELETMRPGAFLINTARGGIVDESALAEALRRGTPRRRGCGRF